MEKLAKAMDAELKLGHGSEPTTTQGPLINARAAEKVPHVTVNKHTHQGSEQNKKSPVTQEYLGLGNTDTHRSCEGSLVEMKGFNAVVSFRWRVRSQMPWHREQS